MSTDLQPYGQPCWGGRGKLNSKPRSVLLLLELCRARGKCQDLSLAGHCYLGTLSSVNLRETRGTKRKCYLSLHLTLCGPLPMCAGGKTDETAGVGRDEGFP